MRNTVFKDTCALSSQPNIRTGIPRGNQGFALLGIALRIPFQAQLFRVHMGSSVSASTPRGSYAHAHNSEQLNKPPVLCHMRFLDYCHDLDGHCVE